MHHWQETHNSLSLIIFYYLIFCLIDFSSGSSSARLAVFLLLIPHRGADNSERLVNPDEEAESTSHSDIYGVIFTTGLYNLCPFTPLFFSHFISSHARKLEGSFYISSLTERGHGSQSQQAGARGGGVDTHVRGDV